MRNAKTFSRSVINGHGYQPIESPEIQARLDAIRKEDPTWYAHLLAFATSFANAGRWHVASLLSTRAIKIARRLAAARDVRIPEPEFTARITGREAFYFNGVATRMCASSLDELAGLESSIEDARLALVYDRKREIPAQIDSARFDSEQQALVLARILFRFFQPRRHDKAVDISELSRQLLQFAGLCDRVDELDDTWIRGVVRHNVLTNYTNGRWQ